MEYSYGYFLITPMLGLFKNYIKYKKVSILLFIRTPIINIFLLHLLTKYTDYPILYSIIGERYFLLLTKALYSFYTNNYYRKKLKYIKKYQIKYEE